MCMCMLYDSCLKKVKRHSEKKIIIPVSGYQPSELTASALYSSPFATIKNRQKK